MTRPKKKRCASCRYDLTSAPTTRCPECGLTPEEAVAARRKRRASPALRVVVLTLCMYAPYGWLLFMDQTNYTRFWMTLWPVLPVLLPGHMLLRGIAPWIEYCAMVVMMLVLAVIVWFAARPSRVAFWIVALIVLALSSINSWMEYHAYRA